MIDLTKSQLNAILSALDNQPRNPNSKDAARKAIGKHAEQLGLTCDEIRTAAAGLLDGRVSPAEFRAALRDDAFGSADFMVEAPAEPADDGADESAERGLHHAECRTTGDHATGPRGQAVASAYPGPNTKQQLLIDLLRRPEGATTEQIAEATGWANRTIRGAIAGVLKKKLGLTVTSEKTDSGERVYRIAE